MSAHFYKETIGGLELIIADSLHGPMPWVEGVQEPLAWFVTLALKGDIPNALEKLDRGEDMSDGAAVYAGPPGPLYHGSPGYAKLQKKWKELTGTEPGDDVYITGASFLDDGFLIPRSVLREILVRYLSARKVTRR